MVRVLASIAVDRGFNEVKPKTIKLVFVASPLSMQHKGEIARYKYCKRKVGYGGRHPLIINRRLSANQHSVFGGNVRHICI
jgi:hypothetical protein